MLNSALTNGAAPRELLSDQALAFDMVGDQQSAQAAYARAIELNPQDDEARRRFALSQAISGDEGGFQTTLAPLLEARDPAAFRTRAFGLAILGQEERASAIVNEVMPRDLALRINPYLAYMPRLTSSQQAAAANLGIFPRAADIGREDPRIARFAAEGAVGSLLEPAGEPLGSPVETVSEEVTQAIPAQTTTEPTQIAKASEADAVPAAPPTESALASASEANAIAEVAQSETQAEPVTPPLSVADAFADLGSSELPIEGSATGAVDLAAIEIPRESAREAEPAQPEHPRRIWVQLATGRNVSALGFDWRRFRRQAPDLLGDYSPHVTPWGQANRLLAGPLESSAAARALINGLSEKGIDTFAYTSPEGTVIQELR